MVSHPLFSLLFTFSTIVSLATCNGSSLFDLRFAPPKANIHIEASLTDNISNEKWLLTEDLAGASVPKGKIHVTHGLDYFDVFYHHHFDNQRTLIADNECKQLKTHSYQWTHMIRQSLLNFILLMGPSFIYRLSDDSIKWRTSIETTDGLKMRVKKTSFNGTLTITMYHKYDTSNDRKQPPSRVTLNGYLGNLTTSPGDKTNVSIVLEIVNVSMLKDNLEPMVAPTTGIGCPSYFQPAKEFPRLKTSQLHFIGTDTVESTHRAKKISYIEIHADSDRKLVRIAEDSTQYTINDYNLAVSYVFNNSKCSIRPFKSMLPGLIGGQLSLNELTWTNGQFVYVGQTVHEPRAQGIFETWESVEYGRIIDEIKYDKVVTTQSMMKLRNTNGSEMETVTYVPVSMQRIAYNRDSEGKYYIEESRRRDISDFEQSIPVTEYSNLFNVGECFGRDQRMILNFDIRSDDSTGCSVGTQFALANLDQFKDSLRTLLTRQISPLRVNMIALDFQIDRVSAKVEFLEKPPLEKSFQKENKKIKVDLKMMTNFDGISAKSIEDCLKTQTRTKYFRKILYCPQRNGLCVDIDDSDRLPETDEKPIECELNSFPLTERWKLAKEVSLFELHKALLQMENLSFTLKCENCSTLDSTKAFKYRILNIMAHDMANLGSIQQPEFMEAQRFASLNPGHSNVHLVNSLINNLEVCYKACVHQGSDQCLTFTHCANGDSHTCYTSNSLLGSNSTLPSSNCTTFTKNFMPQYHKAAKRQFIDLSWETPIDSKSIANCAALCATHSNCKSFQFCADRRCSLSKSVYSAKQTRPVKSCDIYTQKKSSDYVLTSHHQIDQTVYTEISLDLEQCAALCSSWNESDEPCVSFNYCPTGKVESACSLSTKRISDSKVPTRPSSFCYNFEKMTLEKVIEAKAASTHSPDIERASIGSSISTAFLILGMALGIVINSIYHTVKNRDKYRVTKMDEDSIE